jgi:hypothetical protein
MFRATLAVTGIIYIGFVFAVARACAFLRPLIPMIWRDYEQAALLFSALFLLNGGAAVYHVLRWLMLADTGAKLAQIEKGLRGRATISEELTERLLKDR